MGKINFIVQASSIAWYGDIDPCMSLVDGKPVVFWTIKNIIDNFPDSEIVVAAPEFDRGGELDSICLEFNDKCKILYAFDSNPLKRMIVAFKKFFQSSQNYFVRINGQNMFFLPKDIRKMYDIAERYRLDCIKYPDDYPAQLSVDIYNIEALEKLDKILKDDSPYVIHPKYYMFKDNSFRTMIFSEFSIISDDFLLKAREVSRQIFNTSRAKVTSKRVDIADQLTLHYKLAREYIKPDDTVLDIACGEGYGVAYLAEKAKFVFGGDISIDVIERCNKKYKNMRNTEFRVEDITNLSFDDNSLDVVTSFETLEHVNPEKSLKEIYRVLKEDGRLILSTPQNRFGHIPIHASHNREYSLEELQEIVSKYFLIVKTVGIKQGCITDEINIRGSNTFMILMKRRFPGREITEN